ncbi:sodium:proton antiporter [Meridianimarinicoccus roseus]|jgi:multisubunit Na+/H+ antiporter MnhB subunit|uniref:Sodium:proton antiporter n=1 Tax=Meridianimarinicoccus roseus TaxID=2072018 RepID=A0A2V2LC56_9RHOB|nr:hydrogenase subunit MbhD domain-containing protein [Meridianimarinicoccus roseus]PWR01104.1 sodium:proton antiporter [Meridianimarinicoccus roseus]
MIVFDLMLAAAILVAGWSALSAPDRTGAIAGFLVFGLLVALSWVRLDAPDVALAEAAIGSGLTGALMLRAAGRMAPPAADRVPRAQRAAAALLACGLAGGLAVAVMDLPGATIVYDPLVRADLGQSGVSNPVTAVLLNFRAWDTLLEMAVLLAALVLVAALGPRGTPRPARLGPLYTPFLRIMAPLSVLVAGHLLWLGATAPGGAFQAGAVLCGGLLALYFGGALRPAAVPAGPLWALCAAGVAVFAAAALAAEVLTGTLLAYPDGADKIWILAIEGGLTVSIGATLLLLFTGLRQGGARA